ncbi:MAG: hypothetical protein ACE5FT_06185 [Candidatus Nanoarchaeia archaeon]
MRKGQVTVFIVIAILVILFASVAIYFSKEEVRLGAIQAAPTWTQPVQNYVQECVRQTSTVGTYLLAGQGGWISYPEPSLITEHSLIGYHVYNGIKTKPSNEEIEQELDEFIELALPACVKFELFESQGFKIVTERPVAKTRIAKDNVIVSVQYEITLEKADSRTTIDTFAVDLPIRLGRTLEAADTAAQRILKDPDHIILDRLVNRDLDVNIIPYDEETLVYAFSDPASNQEGKPFVLFFASHADTNSPPEFAFTPDFVLKMGMPFSYRVRAADPDHDMLQFKDDTAAFNIDPLSGEIAFTPMALGKFTARITVSDGKASSVQSINFEVEP